MSSNAETSSSESDDGASPSLILPSTAHARLTADCAASLVAVSGPAFDAGDDAPASCVVLEAASRSRVAATARVRTDSASGSDPAVDSTVPPCDSKASACAIRLAVPDPSPLLSLRFPLLVIVLPADAHPYHAP